VVNSARSFGTIATFTSVWIIDDSEAGNLSAATSIRADAPSEMNGEPT
jgi:hypothetical protein